MTSELIAKREKLGPDKYYFDWYCTFEDIWPTLQTYCGKEMVEATHNVLVIGCGNSRLPERMWAAGFRSITCIDISSTVISHMQARYVDREGMDFLCMDAKRMDRFPDDQFDLIIEKACMDSMFASNVSYNGVLVAKGERPGHRAPTRPRARRPRFRLKLTASNIGAIFPS